jgi:glycosyltransferase involved in cell wall biosynthesis
MARMVPGAAAAVAGSLSAFVGFRDSPQRRAALAAAAGAPARYLLYGLDELRDGGVVVRHNLEAAPPGPRWAWGADRLLNRTIRWRGGYGGDFHSVLPTLRVANTTDVVFSTVDTVGIPLLLLQRAGLVRRPLVYVSIGLPERLARLRGERAAQRYADALRGTAAILAYSEHEAALLREVVGVAASAPPVTFVPFGVDTEYFSPRPGLAPDVDVVSIGADPHRDFPLLLRIAARHPELRFRIVCGAVAFRNLGTPPPNVELEIDIPFSEVRDRLARARLVALPVRANSYSGATTVLLQALAMGCPVVVSRTPAIASGYGLADTENCRLVEPGDEESFEHVLLETLADAGHAASLATGARQLAESELSWSRYADAVRTALESAVARH